MAAIDTVGDWNCSSLPHSFTDAFIFEVFLPYKVAQLVGEKEEKTVL
jgi:hypothetical protein